MSDADKILIDRSRWLRRLATIVSCVLVAALGIEVIMVFTSDDVMRDLAYLLPYRLPMLFYLAGVWTIRQAFARLAEGEMFNQLLPILLRRLGLALAGGGVASVFLTQWLWRALIGPASGAWASFDPPAITVGLVGLLMMVLADLMKRAAAMRHELDGFF
jgi:hypothetical protein